MTSGSLPDLEMDTAVCQRLFHDGVALAAGFELSLFHGIGLQEGVQASLIAPLSVELVGVPGRCCLVRERLHIALALRADAAELHVDLDTVDPDLPELVGVAFGKLEPAPAGCRWRVHGYLFFLGYEGGLHILANADI